MFSLALPHSSCAAHDLAHGHRARRAHPVPLHHPYYRQRRANESSGVTPLQFVDAANGVYWSDEGMEWNVNDTHITFPLDADRTPIRLQTLYFLAGVGLCVQAVLVQSRLCLLW